MYRNIETSGITTRGQCFVDPLGMHQVGYFRPFLGGLSLHLNHLIASRMANYDWPFGTLPFGLF